MKKVLIVALFLSLTTASSQVLAASAKCNVVAINNDSITLDCGNKTKSFKIGDEVKIKTTQKKKAIEGC